MARPTSPRIVRAQVVDKALELIDRDGLEAFSIRALGQALGVNGASLYHHFDDKDAILQGVRLRVFNGSRAAEPPAADDSWQDYLRRTTTRYRAALLSHPHAAPLMAPTVLLRPFSLVVRDQVADKLLTSAVPSDLVLAMIDSMEMLAYSSALLNPRQETPQQRLPIQVDDAVPALTLARAKAPRTPDELFALQLRALIAGWAALVDTGPVAG
jgi:AcrR family transcriptional regulator